MYNIGVKRKEENKMKNTVVAIKENETKTRNYIVIDSDIETGKCYAYNPEVGFKVITPHKDRDAFMTANIRRNPFQWMIDFDANKVTVPSNWMND